MAFTVEPSEVDDIEIIDLTDANKDSHQYGVKYLAKFTSGQTVEKIIVFDPRKDIILQVKANAQLWGLEKTGTPGAGNVDITNVAVPWIVLKDILTNSKDFDTGGGTDNRGVLAVRITTGVLTGDFEIFAASQKLEERPA